MSCLFTRAEMQSRVASLQARMVQQGIELALFDEMEAMFWLSGYANSENRWRACLVPASGDPFFVIRALDAAALRDRTWLSDIVTYRDWDDPVMVLADTLTARSLAGATIGTDHYSYACRWPGLPDCCRRCRLHTWSILGAPSGNCA